MGSERRPISQLKLEDFAGDGFEVKDLVGRLTAPLLQRLNRAPSTASTPTALSTSLSSSDHKRNPSSSDHKRNPSQSLNREDEDGVFDPAPFRELFSNSLKQLNLLREESERKIRTAVKESQNAEKIYQERMLSLNQGLSGVLGNFRHLDRRIAQVSHTASLIGHTLESVDRQKHLNAKGQEVIQQFLALHRARDGDNNQSLLPSDPHEAATTIQQLVDIAEGLEIKGSEKTKELIKTKATHIEKLLLDKFKSAKRDDALSLSKKVSLMKACAQSLAKFKNQLVVQAYIDDVLDSLQRTFESEGMILSDDEKSSSEKKKRFTRHLDKFQRLILETVSKEWQLIAQVFPVPWPSGVFKVLVTAIVNHQVIECAKCNRQMRVTPSLGQLCLCANPTCKNSFQYDPSLALPLDRIRNPITTVKRFLDLTLGSGTTPVPSPTTTPPGRRGSGGIGFPTSATAQNLLHIAGNAFAAASHSLSSSTSNPTLPSATSPTPPATSSPSPTTISPSSTTATSPPVAQKDLFDWSPEEYLEALLIGHQSITDLVNGLKQRQVELVEFLKKLPSTATQGQLHGGATMMTISTSAELSSDYLHTYLVELFQPFRRTYVDRELTMLLNVVQKQFDQVFSEASVVMEKGGSVSHPHTHPPSHQPHSTPETKLLSLSKDTDEKIRGFLRRIRGKEEMSPDELKVWIAKVLKTSVIKSVIFHSQFAVDRCTKISLPEEAPDNVYQLISLFFKLILDCYLIPTLQKSATLLPPSDPKTPPDTFHFQVVHMVTSIHKQIRKHYQDIATVIASDSNTLTICESRWREVTRSIEEQMHSGLERTLTATLRYTSRLLSKQKNSNYKPKDDSAVLEENKVCTQVCELIQSQYSACLTSLDGKNLDQYLTVLASKFYQILVSQLKKTSVSPVGAANLAKDIKHYQECFHVFDLTAVDELFEQLRTLCNLFFVTCDNLRVLITENRQLSTMDRELIHEFVKMRQDYSQNKSKILAQLA